MVLINPIIFLFRYLWFVAVPIGIINTFLARSRLSPTLKEHPEWEAESREFLRGYFQFVTLPPLILGLLQVLGGFSDAFYVFSSDVNVYVVLSWCVFLLTWTILFRWVFFRDGARTIVKFRRAVTNFPVNETMVKVWVMITLPAGFCALVVGIAYDVGGIVSQILAEWGIPFW